jgi:hypothetical protein
LESFAVRTILSALVGDQTFRMVVDYSIKWSVDVSASFMAYVILESEQNKSLKVE